MRNPCDSLLRGKSSPRGCPKHLEHRLAPLWGGGEPEPRSTKPGGPAVVPGTDSAHGARTLGEALSGSHGDAVQVVPGTEQLVGNVLGDSWPSESESERVAQNATWH